MHFSSMTARELVFQAISPLTNSRQRAGAVSSSRSARREIEFVTVDEHVLDPSPNASNP